MATKKWQVLEGVVAAIERSLNAVRGTRVIPNAAVPMRGRSATRQVDVLVEIPTGRRTLRIGVEVRCFATPLDVTHVEQLGAKLSKLDLDRGCVVSASGFTEEARSEALRCNLETRTVAEVGLPDWWLATSMQVQFPKLLTCRLDYPPELVEELAPKIDGVKLDDAMVITPSDPPCSIRSLVHQTIAGRLQIEGRHNQDMIKVRILVDLPDGSYLRLPSGDLPLPASIHAVVEVCTESAPVSAYCVSDQVSAFTAVVLDDKQLTLMVELQPDGTRKVTGSYGDAAPKVTRVRSVEREQP